MSRSEVARGCAVMLCVIVAGSLSIAAVDRYFAARERSEAEPASACVDPAGSWTNWPYPNVPTLSPKCSPDR